MRKTCTDRCKFHSVVTAHPDRDGISLIVCMYEYIICKLREKNIIS